MAAGKIKAQDFLSKLPLFSDIAQPALDRIAATATNLHVPRGGVVFRRGDSCAGFHTVIYGQVKLVFNSRQGAEKVVEIIGPGHSFGEALMFMEKPYIVTAEALADSLLLHITRLAVLEEIGRDAAFACKMLAGLSRRLHGLMSDVEAYSLRSGTQRVIGYLLKGDASADGDCIRLQASKTVIASRLNLTPEHFSRILHELVEDGLICVDGRNITILDFGRLHGY